jgi:hypothetical protein
MVPEMELKCNYVYDGYGLDKQEIRVQFSAGADIFLFSQHPNRL